MRYWTLSLISMATISCVSSPQPKLNSDHLQKLESLTKRVKAQELEISRLRGENLVLRRKNGLNPSKIKTALNRIGTEKALYAHILKAYKAGDEANLKAGHRQFLEKYPLSAQADDVLFILGKFYQNKQQWGQALSYFDRVIRSYPRGNRVVSALYGKGRAYQRLNLKGQALSQFKKVLSQYPGSMEAKRIKAKLNKGSENKLSM